MSPFVCVTGQVTPISHLVVVSPAMPGTAPGVLPTLTLCAQPVDGSSPVSPGEVACLRCLARAPQFMWMPSYTVEVTL